MFRFDKSNKLTPMETKISCSAAKEIVLTCEKIAQSFLENIFELSSIRMEWDMQFARDLISRINTVKIHYLSSLSSHMFPNKPECVHEVLISSLTEISLLHALIKVDFKDDITFQNHIFETLGYTRFYSDARNGDLFSLYKLLDVYRKNLTDDINEVITSRTISPKLVNKIRNLSNQVDKFNYCIELTNQSKMISRDGCVEINKLYSVVKDICRMTTAYYTFDVIRRDQFSFFSVMQNLEKPIMRMN